MSAIADFLRDFQAGLLVQQLGPDWLEKLKQLRANTARIGVETERTKGLIESEKLGQEKTRKDLAQEEVDRAELAKLGITSTKAQDAMLNLKAEERAGKKEGREEAAHGLAMRGGEAELLRAPSPEEARRAREAELALKGAHAQYFLSGGAGGGVDGAGSDAVSFLLQGGTADKLPIKIRAAATNAARQSGGVDGTGFVPMNAQHQTKFTDFQDLRRKAARLHEILMTDPSLAQKLGPIAGRYVGATKEFGGKLGQPTLVKEAFDLFKDLSDTELRKRSGAAISPGEYARITGFTVDPAKQLDSNLVNLNRMLDSIDAAMQTIGATPPPRLGAGGGAGGGRRIRFDAQGNVIP